MLRLNVEKLKQEVQAYDGIRTAGKLRSARGVLTASMSAAVGEMCHIKDDARGAILAESIGFDRGLTQIMPYHRISSRPELT